MDRQVNFPDWLTEIDAETFEQLSVPELINALQLIHRNVSGDPVLADLAEPIRSVAHELWRRRELARRIADEADSEKCQLKH